MENRSWRIPAKQGAAFRLNKGEVVRVTDVEGEQVADFVAYFAADTAERLDPGVSMDALQAMKVKPNDLLYSNKYRPMLRIVADQVGQHDFINPACRAEMYEVLYDKKGHASCYDNLNRALEEFGIPVPDQHYPFNLFMNTVVHASGKVTVERPLSQAGDWIELKAEEDLIIGISACPCEESVCNGYVCTPIDVEIKRLGQV